MRTWLIATSLMAGALALPAYLGAATDRTGGHRTRHAEAPWYQTAIRGNVMHFLHRDPPEIRRHDFAAGEWLDPVALSDTPTAFAVGEEQYYVAYDEALYEVAPAVGAEFEILEVPAPVFNLLLDSNFLFYSTNHLIGSISRESGELISELQSSSLDIPRQGVLLESRRLVVGRTEGSSPADVIRFSYNSNGQLAQPRRSPYHGVYPSARWTMAHPDGNRVLDQAGILYNLPGLTYSNNLAGEVDDAVFIGAQLVVRRGDRLVLFAGDFEPLGIHDPGYPVLALATHDGEVVAYVEEEGTITTRRIPLSAFTPLLSAEQVDATNLAYEPDGVRLGDGVVYLLDSERRNVYRWSLDERAYLDPYTLTGSPAGNHFDYMAWNATLYFLHPDGRLVCIALDEGTERHLANLPHTPIRGLAAMGRHLLAIGRRHGSSTSEHVIFDEGGALIDSRPSHHFSRVYVWSEANRRLYYFRDGINPNDVNWLQINEDGTIAGNGDSPEHGGVDVSLPLSVSPDGSLVLTGGGYLRHGLSLAQTGLLPNTVDGATWRGDAELITTRVQAGETQIQVWAEDFGDAEATAMLPGTPLEILWTGEQFLVITLNAGFPQFHLLDGELNVEFQSAIPTTLWHLY